MSPTNAQTSQQPRVVAMTLPSDQPPAPAPEAATSTQRHDRVPPAEIPPASEADAAAVAAADDDDEAESDCEMDLGAEYEATNAALAAAQAQMEELERELERTEEHAAAVNEWALKQTQNRGGLEEGEEKEDEEVDAARER